MASRTPGVESPRRVLQLLLLFSESRPHATIAELANEIDVPASTCYRYVSLLREMGLVEEGDSGTYHVAPRIWSVARAASAAEPLSRVALPVMRRLSEQTGESVMLLRLIADSAVCVELVPSNRAVRITYEPGHPMPLHHGASGKSLLAFLPLDRRTSYLDAHSRFNPALAERRPALEAELDEIARHGWACSHSEIDEGIWACSAIIRHRAHVEGTLTVVGPEFRIPEASQEEIRKLLLASSQEIAERLRADQLA